MGINAVVAAWRGVVILLLGEGRMNIDKFIDSWFTGRFLKHPVVVAVIFYLIGYAVGQA